MMYKSYEIKSMKLRIDYVHCVLLALSCCKMVTPTVYITICATEYICPIHLLVLFAW